MRRLAPLLVLGLVACRHTPAEAPAATKPVASAPPIASATAKPIAPVTSAFRVLDPTRLEVIARTNVFDAKGADGRVFALDKDVRQLIGFELATGRELWRTPLGVAPSGRVTLHPNWAASQRVLVHVENNLLLFDPATGALTRSDGPWNHEKLSFADDEGACNFYGPGDLFFVDCHDAHPYGPVLRIAETHLYAKLGAPHDTVWWGPRHVVGRAGNVVVAVTDGRTWEPRSDGPLTVGIDASTGKVAWTSSDVGCARCASSGFSSDGATCWLAGDDGALDVFACATGKLRFRKKLPVSDSTPALFTTWTAGGLFLSTRSEAMLVDPQSGKTRWSTPLPDKALALPLATKLDLPAFSTWSARAVLLLDPASGKEASRFALPEYTEITQTKDLGLEVKGGPAFDPKGKPRASTIEPERFTLEREVKPRRLRAGDHVLAEVTTDLAIVAENADTIALFVWPDELIFARVRK